MVGPQPLETTPDSVTARTQEEGFFSVLPDFEVKSTDPIYLDLEDARLQREFFLFDS